MQTDPHIQNIQSETIIRCLRVMLYVVGNTSRKEETDNFWKISVAEYRKAEAQKQTHLTFQGFTHYCYVLLRSKLSCNGNRATYKLKVTERKQQYV